MIDIVLRHIYDIIQIADSKAAGIFMKNLREENIEREKK